MIVGLDKMIKALDRAGKAADGLLMETYKRFTFEARDVIQQDVADALEYSGSNTKRFISKFKAQYTKQGPKFHAKIYPAGKKSESLLARHVERYRQTPADRADLLVNGRMAIPLGSIKRNSRGRIKESDRPSALLERDLRGRTKGFVSKSGRVLLRREGKDVRPAFVLESSTTNPKRVDVWKSFAKAIDTKFVVAAGKALRKALFG